MVDGTFYKNTIKNNCIFLLCHVSVRSSRQEAFCKKGVLRNFAEACNFIKKETLAQFFSCEFSKIFKNTFPYRAFLVAASCVSEWIYTFSFRTSCLKQTQYLKFKSTVTLRKYSRSNISNKFSLQAFRLLQWKCAPPKTLCQHFLTSIKIFKKGLYHRPFSLILIISFRTHHVSSLLKLSFSWL